MRFVKSWQEYKDNWVDLWQCLTNWGQYGYLNAILGIMITVIVGAPCCLIGLVPSEG